MNASCSLKLIPGVGMGYRTHIRWALVMSGIVALLCQGSRPVPTSPSSLSKVEDSGFAVVSNGDARFYGSMGGHPLKRAVVGMASTPDGKGYWEVATDGGIFAFGDAGFHGSTGGETLSKPVIGMAPTPDGRGYWEVARDGGIFAL